MTELSVTAETAPRARGTLAPALFGAIAVVIGAIAAYEWWGWVASGALGVGVGAALIWAGQRGSHPVIESLGYVLAALSLSCATVVLILCAHSNVGYVHARSEWPKELERMVVDGRVDPESVKVACLGGSHYVWRLDLAPSAIAELVRNRGLAAIDAAQVPADVPDYFPIWWRPTLAPTTRCWRTPEHPTESRGESGRPDGDFFYLMYEQPSGRLFVVYDSNF